MHGLLDLDKYVAHVHRWIPRGRRYPTATTVTVSCPQRGVFKAALVDLSAKGARLRVAVNLPVDTPMILEIPEMRLLSGYVVWSKARELGICFDEPLDEAELGRLVVRTWIKRV
ncbi:PilZ domain-containing protein [Sphingomonas bacterium]|uniref:PilZ domain-containing protein n=1 Tax=Sphingomonas bacterium TaxID=1895847 RepID=UPI00260DE4E6|nr:PilZ domain-containing protein [Sphingomonas bacterium]MDB5678506.1 hypothetical protein [Sphingomonas bacterium]